MKRLPRYVLLAIAILSLYALSLPLAALAQETTDVDDQGSLLDSLLNMSPVTLYMALAAIVLPFVIATINRGHWSSEAKLAVTAVACTIASAGWFLFHGDIVPVGKTLRLTLLIFVGATIFYRAFKPTVTKVERATG
jgi:hypothetical protein